MSLLGKILGKVTARPHAEAAEAEARRASKLAAEAAQKIEAMRADIRNLHADLKRQFTDEIKVVQDLQEEVRGRARGIQRDLRERLLQYHLQLGRLARVSERNGVVDEDPTLGGRAVPLKVKGDVDQPLEWNTVGEGVVHPDPAGREWMLLDRCPVCGCDRLTVVNPWNKLLLLRSAPDATSIRYDYAICHACGVLSALRRPFGSRFKFLLDHFGEVTAKRGGGREIGNRLLNPYPLTDDDRDELRRLARPGVFVSDHLENKDYLSGLLRDRFENSGHIDIIGSLLQPRNARVIEVRARTGSLLDGLRRHWGADVYAMPIWESQQFLLQEVYDIPASELIDFDNFRLGFDGPFDLIIAQHMVTHVVRPHDFFAEVRRHLKPGGHLYLHNEPDDEEFLGGKQSMIAMLNPLHMQAFDQRSIVRALAANGFEMVFLKRHDDTHICLARVSPDVQMTPLEPGGLKRRIEQYERAYDRAVLRLDDEVRSRVGEADWSRVVERAVASGVAEFDEEGRLRIVARGHQGAT